MKRSRVSSNHQGTDDNIIDNPPIDTEVSQHSIANIKNGDIRQQSQPREVLREICNDSLAGTQEPPTED